MTVINTFNWRGGGAATTTLSAMIWRHGRVARARPFWLALAVAALLAAAGAVWHFTRGTAQPTAHFVEVSSGAYTLPKPDRLAPFQLVRHDGTAFTNASLKDRWSFVIFGYTFCPDFCPTTLVEFTHLHKLLAAAPQGVQDVQFVMVSVDPERDTPQLLSQYVPQFNPSFIGVTGDAEQIKRLADSVGAVYARVPGSRGNNYLIDHSTAVLLINPQGALQGVFAAPHVAKEMALGFAKMRAP